MVLKFVLLLLALTSFDAMAADRVTGKLFATRSAVMAPSAMAATSHPLATQIALDIMKGGGNAIDAAIAANAALGLMEPTGNGIGGDLFAIVWDATTESLHGLNASGRSPRTLSREWFADNGIEKIPAYGPLPVSVPGAVDGWFELHGRFGKLPMIRILQPAIDYARNGHPVHETIAHYWDLSIGKRAPYPGFLEQMTIDGRAPAAGELWKNPNLANTLERLAKEGRDAFYKGEMAQIIADYMQANGGFLSYEDMASHASTWINPVSVNYRGYDVWELPPNGQGVAALQILQIMEQHDVAAMGFGSADYIHLFLEAKKLAFEDRARFYADPAYMDVPVEKLLSEAYAADRNKLIDMNIAARQFPHGDPAVLRDGDTIYLTTADSEGNMVSLIQSNYRGMGSGMTPPGLGFVLQDRGELFNLQAGHPNSFEPGKLPFHTIIPAFVTKDGRPFISFGLMGGGMQPQGHAQIVANIIDFGMGLQEAGDAPRIHHTGSSEPTGETMVNGGIVNLETGFGYEIIRELMARGHRIQPAAGPFGGYQAIMKHPGSGVYVGASESRKDGQAAGY
ncbi:MAG: gamma-glutamyltransferase [Xanthomonadales bacterium]|nr:gamma-glutamyltransferase [Gammaproteobacteria bacterium]MBT8054965.1 gamma-glutamyltransferase [Gammaproteobacteria bacterium]NND56347.1 gamma-glutamyltransferase [Xanthomonadales bacterium]NNK52887.1 gamma-glutamyltransferase [Xanthomonadales bacterium]